MTGHGMKTWCRIGLQSVWILLLEETELYTMAENYYGFDWVDSSQDKCFSQLPNIDEVSAVKEPAWKDSEKVKGLKIWRIEKMHVEDWPEDMYGDFYNGDSYIVLHATEVDEGEPQRDVHFWIGQNSTQDEYSVAAYKTVELDTYLGGKATQHRETQGLESPLFKSYFSNITILNGGVDTGFRQAEETKFSPRLLRVVVGDDYLSLQEVPRSFQILQKSDTIFILHTGDIIYIWRGKDASEHDGYKALQAAERLASTRNAKVEVLDEETIEDSHDFYSYLADEDIPDGYNISWYITTEKESKKIYKLSDVSGNLEFVEEDNSKITSVADLNGDDIYIIDTPFHCYVWIGAGSSRNEKKNALIYAHRMLRKSNHPLVPVSVILQGRKNPGFEAAITI